MSIASDQATSSPHPDALTEQLYDLNNFGLVEAQSPE
jgi:hypothetical protein